MFIELLSYAGITQIRFKGRAGWPSQLRRAPLEFYLYSFVEKHHITIAMGCQSKSRDERYRTYRLGEGQKQKQPFFERDQGKSGGRYVLAHLLCQEG